MQIKRNYVVQINTSRKLFYFKELSVFFSDIYLIYLPRFVFHLHLHNDKNAQEGFLALLMHNYIITPNTAIHSSFVILRALKDVMI